VTALAPRRTLLPLRHTGAVRRLLLTGGAAVVWVVAVVLMVAGFLPELEGAEVDLDVQLGQVLLGLAVAALPVLLLWVPERRRVRVALDALLEFATDAAGVPPVEQWCSPAVVFERMRWRAAIAVAIPTIALTLAAASYATVLDEAAAAIICAVFALVPLAFLAVVVRLPQRLTSGLRAGLALGQVVPLRIERRVDQRLRLSSATQSWFEAVLPDGQTLLLRTPIRRPCEEDARGVVTSPDLLLVIGRGAHQGVLLVPSRPEAAVWLLGPVPLVRAPVTVLKDLASTAR
jgi:hypothetical protein